MAVGDWVSDLFGAKNYYQAQRPEDFQDPNLSPEVQAARNASLGIAGQQQTLAGQMAGASGVANQAALYGQQQGLAGQMAGAGAVQNQTALYGQQQGLAGALAQRAGDPNAINFAQANAALGTGNQLLGQVMERAAGGGPNPALEQLKQTTAQNIQQASGMIASQRGLNPAMAARTAAQTGAGMNQQAAGQAAIQAAQQQIAAQQQAGQLVGQQAAQYGQFAQAQAQQQLMNTQALQQQYGQMAGLSGQQIAQLQGQQAQMAGLAGQQAGQQIQQLGIYGNQGLQQQALEQQARAAYNQQQVGMQSNINAINAGVAQQNAQTNAAVMGGIGNAVGGVLGMGGSGKGDGSGGVGLAGKLLGLLHKGGRVQNYAEGGVALAAPRSALHQYLDSLSTVESLRTQYADEQNKQVQAQASAAEDAILRAGAGAVPAEHYSELKQFVQQNTPEPTPQWDRDITAVFRKYKDAGARPDVAALVRVLQRAGEKDPEGYVALRSALAQHPALQGVLPDFPKEPTPLLSPEQTRQAELLRLAERNPRAAQLLLAPISADAAAQQTKPGDTHSVGRRVSGANAEVPQFPAAASSWLGSAPPTMEAGGEVTAPPGGQADVRGDSARNDKVPALLSEQEIVLPRSVTMAQDAPEQAKLFVQHLLAREGRGFENVVKARGGR